MLCHELESRRRRGSTGHSAGNFTLLQGQAGGPVHPRTNSIEWVMPDDTPGDSPPTPKPKVPRPDGGGAVVAERKAARTKPPSLYQVVMLNDDYTPMEFVVMVLQSFFQRDTDTAMHIMLKIHHEGRGICGVYPKDVAATKVELVLTAARREGHPLQCIMEAA
jgi:ATP-dependent Clp protease adaptor protein ClpS